VGAHAAGYTVDRRPLLRHVGAVAVEQHAGARLGCVTLGGGGGRGHHRHLLGRPGFPGEDLNTFSHRMPLWSATPSASQDRPVAGFAWAAVCPHSRKPSLLNIVLDGIWSRSDVPLTHRHDPQGSNWSSRADCWGIRSWSW
jgi:hypothetical protein